MSGDSTGLGIERPLYHEKVSDSLDFWAEVRVNAGPSPQGAHAMTTVLTEAELAARWCISPKTLERWRSKQTGPEYLKFGKHVRYPLEAVADYESQTRTNVVLTGADEILRFLEQTGPATIDQIRAACLGGKKSHYQIKTRLYRLARATPPKVKVSLVCLDPNSTVTTAIYSICTDDGQP